MLYIYHSSLVQLGRVFYSPSSRVREFQHDITTSLILYIPLTWRSLGVNYLRSGVHYMQWRCRSRISDYLGIEQQWDIINHPCPNFNEGTVEPPLKIEKPNPSLKYVSVENDHRIDISIDQIPTLSPRRQNMVCKLEIRFEAISTTK